MAMRRGVVLAVALAASLFGATASPAAAPKRVALVIGNWDYNANGRFDDTPPPGFAHDLHSPCGDAEHVKAALVRKAFDVVKLCNQTRAQWDRAIADFGTRTANLPDGSIIFIYYSGHGLQYHGYSFSVPVGYSLSAERWGGEPAAKQLDDLNAQANDLTRALEKLNGSTKVAVVVALDACRDSPLAKEDPSYNKAVSILVPPNALIQYATTPGNRLPDSDAKVSTYATELAAAIDRGRDIGNAMTQVYSRIWTLYQNGGNGEAYADMNTGPAFVAMKSFPITVSRLPDEPRPPPDRPASTTTGPIVRTPQKLRATEDGLRFDVLWCGGEDEAAHYAYAMTFAREVAARAHEFGVGRVQVKILPAAVNPQGYNVHRNLMRYDVGDPRERNLLNRVAVAFPEGNFLPQQGIGVNGKPTWNYVSAFVCGRTGT